MKAIILAGGESRRMGTDKAFLPWGEYSLIEFLVDRLRPLFSEVAVVTKKPEKFTGMPVKVISDLWEERSSMIGLYSGLAASGIASKGGPDIHFVIPCDTPLIPMQLIQEMAALAQDFEILVLGEGPKDNPIPLPGFYQSTVLPKLRDRILKEDYRISSFLEECDYFAVPEGRWREWDPDGHSRLNLNTPQEYQEAYIFAEPSR